MVTLNLFISDLLTSDFFNRTALLLIDAFAIWLVFRVYTSDPSKKANRLFSLVTISFLFWVNGGYFFSFSNNLEFSLMLGRIILGGVIWSFVILYFFLIHFPAKDTTYPFLDKIVILIGIIFSFFAIFTSFIVKDVQITEWGINPIYGPYGKLSYYSGIFFLIIVAIYQISKKYPRLLKAERTKVQYFFVGLSIFLIMNLVFNVFMPVLRNSIQFWQFGNYAAIFLLGFTAYAIVEHQLLNIKVIAAEALTVVTWVVLFSKLFVTKSTPERIQDIIILIALIVFGIMLIRSVAREVKQREKLQELTKKLKELDRQKNEFISMAAHELRAPITAIKGYISMIAEGDAGEISEKARGYLTDANAVNERLIRLVNNMLNVSRIEERRLVYQMEVVNLSRIAKQTFDAFKFEALRKELKFTLNIPDDIRDKIYVDSDRINEIVGNLVSNAIKFTEKGRVDINITNPQKDSVRVEIVDTGPGISKKEQEKLFKKFYRAESTQGKTMGTGLGLYISKLLVEAFKGKIGLISEFGKGSTFWFELPLTSKNVSL